MSDEEDQRFGAARFGDEITHGMGMVGMVGGAVLGLIVGAVIVGASVATGGLADLAFVAIVGGSIAGGGLSGGSLIKGIMKHFNMPGPVSGTLAQGVPTTRINGRPVMRAGVDYAEECSGAPMTHFKRERVIIAEGSGTVRFNGYPAARVGSKLTCGATIKTGSSNVFIGGPTVLAVKPEDMDDNEAAFEDILGKLGIVALVCGGAIALAAGGAGILVFGAIIGGTKFALNAAHKWGDSLGPGCGDIVEGVLGFAMLGLGAKGADSEVGQAAMEGRLRVEADPNSLGMNGGNLRTRILPKSGDEPIDYGNIPEEHQWRYDRYLNRDPANPLPPDAWYESAQRAWENTNSGNEFERAVREKLGTPTGPGSKPISIDGYIPDLPVGEEYGVTDVKNWVDVTNNDQLRAFQQHAVDNDLPFNIIVGPRTQTISEPLLDNIKATGGKVTEFNPDTEDFTEINIDNPGPWKRN